MISHYIENGKKYYSVFLKVRDKQGKQINRRRKAYRKIKRHIFGFGPPKSSSVRTGLMLVPKSVDLSSVAWFGTRSLSRCVL